VLRATGDDGGVAETPVDAVDGHEGERERVAAVVELRRRHHPRAVAVRPPDAAALIRDSLVALLVDDGPERDVLRHRFHPARLVFGLHLDAHRPRVAVHPYVGVPTRVEPDALARRPAVRDEAGLRVDLRHRPLDPLDVGRRLHVAEGGRAERHRHADRRDREP